MMENNMLSVEHMTAMLDLSPMAVFVASVETREVYYANRLAKEKMLQHAGGQTICCYHAAGFDRPCAFCHTDQASCTELLVREFCHPVDGRVYQISGKLIDWDGKLAHIEYILDITNRKREEELSRKLKEELQTTFSSIPCGLCVYQVVDGQISPLFHNPAFYEIMGYSEEHILRIEQQTDFLGVHPEDMQLLQWKILRAIEENGSAQHTYRVWNDREEAYHWIRLDGIVKPREDGGRLLYGVYSDVSKEKQLEKELTDTGKKLQTLINAIPGGVAIYKISNVFELLYFSDGVPQLSGYTAEEYKELVQKDAASLIYPEDAAFVAGKLQEAVQTHAAADFEFRQLHQDGSVVWVHVQARQIGEDDGFPLFQLVFHNITELKKAQLGLDNLVNSIPGGIVIYRVEGTKFIPSFSSDGVMALTGHTREEYREMIREDAFNVIYEPDRRRVYDAAQVALQSGELLDISYRTLQKDGNLIWVHLNGRRMGPLSKVSEFCVVFTGMSEESRMYQNIANETADGVYVIDKESYELLYANETKDLFTRRESCIGQKCYVALHGKDAPCSFCSLRDHAPDGEEHAMVVDGTGKFYTTRFRETDWNGVPAYVKYIRDVTEEVNTRMEKERLELYFQTIVKNVAGGIAVIHHKKDGSMVPEFVSDGFAGMLGMTAEEAWDMYRQDAMTGVHPDDYDYVEGRMNAYIASGDTRFEMMYRLQNKGKGYAWVKASFSMMQNDGGDSFIYAFYNDITKEREEQEQIRQQYNDMLLQHYSAQGANVLVVGHCNVTRNQILEILDYTDSGLLKTFGSVREDFFKGLSTLVLDEAERQLFLGRFLNEPARAAYERHETEQVLTCFVKLPKEKNGRYVEIMMNLVDTPETSDITGVLTVTDVTNQTISDRILHQLSVTSYDYVVDLDIEQNEYTVLAYNKNASYIPHSRGMLSERVDTMTKSVILQKDRELYREALEPAEIRRRLEEKGAYTISYSLTDEQGAIRTKNMTVSAVDLRLNRVCLVCTDITDSVRALENALALAEEGSRAKSDFLSAMSHDIRTPMNAIMGMTDIAAAHLDDRARIEDCLRKISISGKHLLSLVNDILDMSRIERSQMVMNRMDTSLPHLMRQVVTIIEPQAKAAGLHFAVQYEEFPHPYFYGDALRVNQILINLLSNAVKFTQQGEVKFLAEEIPPVKNQAHIRYRFMVADTGMGMSEEFLERLFDPFVRSSRTARIEGTGLGLSITKGLVDQMEGEISVTSRVGEGSCFLVELEFEPAKNEQAVQTEEAWAESIQYSKEKAFSGRRFLVAEDNALNSEILCELLEMQGAELVVKTDGRQALEAFISAAPGVYDAILMDIQMPEMDGHEATRAIRILERPDAKIIPIIAMTANAFAEDVQKAKDAGMTAHVAKPIDIDVVRVTLERALDKEKQR